MKKKIIVFYDADGMPVYIGDSFRIAETKDGRTEAVYKVEEYDNHIRLINMDVSSSADIIDYVNEFYLTWKKFIFKKIN